MWRGSLKSEVQRSRVRHGLEMAVAAPSLVWKPASFASAVLSMLAASPSFASDAPRAMDLQTPPDLQAVCAATAPIVLHPVALDWSRDGQLWVAESVPGSDAVPDSGRVVRLSDRDRDGRFERRDVFLEGIPPVSSVLDWPPGVLIAAAPDLLYAEDSTGDGVADVARRLFVGFGAESSQRRLNSMTSGLDGWVYVANGMAGGQVQPLDVGSSASPGQLIDLIDLDETDFRFSPENGRLEPVAGLSWTGRTRDEWGAWLGLDAELGLVEFPLPRHYLVRNPALEYPDPVVAVRDLQGRPLHLGTVLGPEGMEPGGSSVAPGGTDFFRANSLEAVQRGDLLVAMPWTHEILRVPLQPAELGFVASATAEQLVSARLEVTESLFTPTQVRTGPDDAIWIADCCFSADSSSTSTGRIIRVEPPEPPSAGLPGKLAWLRLSPVEALASPNGTLRDLAHRWIVVGQAAVDLPHLAALARGEAGSLSATLTAEEASAVRVQALLVMRQLGRLRGSDLEAALVDPNPMVRVHALRLSEPDLQKGKWPEAIAQLAGDPNPRVRFQLALSLGEATAPQAADVWVHLAQTSNGDPRLAAALLSAAATQPLRLLGRWLEANADARNSEPVETITRNLVRTARLKHSPKSVATALASSRSRLGWVAVAELIKLELSQRPPEPSERSWLSNVETQIVQARTAVETGECSLSDLPLALSMLGADLGHLSQDRQILLAHARKGATSVVREAALRTLLRSKDLTLAELLLADWAQWRPSLRPTILGALTAQSMPTSPLLHALASGNLTVSELSPAQRDRLLHHPDSRIRTEATTLLTALLPPPRARIINDYQEALTLKGSPSRGREIFEARCAACHAPASPLLPIGPDMATIGSRTPAELALAILDPNALVEPDYRAFFIEVQGDESVTGLIRHESDESLELLVVGGTTSSLPIQRVMEIRASNLSLMPEGLEAGLSSAEFADLLAAIQSLR